MISVRFVMVLPLGSHAACVGVGEKFGEETESGVCERPEQCCKRPDRCYSLEGHHPISALGVLYSFMPIGSSWACEVYEGRSPISRPFAVDVEALSGYVMDRGRSVSREEVEEVWNGVVDDWLRIGPELEIAQVISAVDLDDPDYNSVIVAESDREGVAFTHCTVANEQTYEGRCLYVDCDIVLNRERAYALTLDDQPGEEGISLRWVLAHELGHVFGLGDQKTDGSFEDALMWGYYDGDLRYTGPGADDYDALIWIYGRGRRR